MTSAYETYRTLSDSAARAENASVQDTLRDARFLINRVQHQVLAAQPDGFRRQLCGILFAHTLQAFDLANVYDTPEAWTQRDEETGRHKGLRTAALAGACVLFLLCCVQLYFIREILLLVGFAAAAFLVFACWALREKPKPERIHLTQRINAGRLDAYLEACMRAIDRDMEALDLLLPSDLQAPSDEMLDIAAKVLEIDRAGVEPLPASIRHAVDSLLVQQGITLVEYTEDNAPLFQTLPTQRASRTLVPAMLRGDHLARAGLAILTTQQAQEEA